MSKVIRNHNSKSSFHPGKSIIKLKPMWQHIILIVLLSTIVYANTLHNEFVYDDGRTIVENKLIRDLKNIPCFFVQPFRSTDDSYLLSNVYRPLVMSSLAVNYKLGGLNVVGYHITSILLHISNAVMVYLLIILLLGMEWAGDTDPVKKKNINTIGLVTALLFVVHPVNSEAVNYIWQRSELMGSLFFMLALVMFTWNLIQGKTGRYLLSVIFYILALFSKEIAITLPLVLLLVDWYYNSGLRKDKFFKSLVKYHLPFMAVSLVYVFFRVFYYGVLKDMSSPTNAGVFRYFITQFRVIIMYFRLLVLPAGLSVDHVFPLSESILDTRVIVSLATIIMIIILAVRLVRVSKTASLLVLWFFITLIPTSSFMPLYPIIMNEHRIYLSGIGIFAACLIMLFKYLPERTTKKILPAVLLMVLGMFSVMTIKRNTVWNDRLTLWSDNLKKYPNSETALVNRGGEYRQKELYNKALADFNEAIAINPRQIKAYCNRGYVYQKMEKYDKAIADYSRAIELNPGYNEAYTNRGNVYLIKGMYDRALADYSKVIELWPGESAAYCNKGAAYQKMGLEDMAIAEFTKSIEMNPEFADAYYNRGIMYEGKGYYDKVLADLNKVVELNPSDEDTCNRIQKILGVLNEGNVTAGGENKDLDKYNNLGVIHGRQGLYDKAIEYFSKAIEVNPAYAKSYYNRGLAHVNNNDSQKALNDFNKTIELDPGYIYSYENRGIIFLERKLYKQALADINKVLELNPKCREGYQLRSIIRKKLNKHDLARQDEELAQALMRNRM